MRRHIFHILIVVLLLCPAGGAAIHQARADTSWCRPTNVPQISVTTDTDRITWVFNHSKKNLDGAHIDTVNPYGNNVITDVGGLMHGGIKMEEQMQFGSLINPNVNETCMYYGKIGLSFHIFPTIYIASEYPQGSCMFNAIREHELKHINVDREIVNKYAITIGNLIKSEIARQPTYGPVPNSNRQSLQAQMKSRMEIIMKQVNGQIDEERRVRQQKVDSLQEYERVNHLCPP